ncbi:MAG: hypothetical protein AAF694_04520 [Bacteroidota bacterium]
MVFLRFDEMEEILQKFHISQKKVSRLEQLILHFQSRHSDLEHEVLNLRKKLEEKDQEIQQLTEKYEAVKLAKGLDASIDSAELIAKIDKYLKEIDICLRYFGVQE